MDDISEDVIHDFEDFIQYQNLTINDIEGDYINVNSTYNISRVENLFDVTTVIYTHPNPDYFYVNHFNEGGLDNVKIVHENNITYIGNNSYLISPYWNQIVSTFFYKGVGTPLTSTTHQITDCDYIRVTSTDQQPNLYLAYWNGINERHVEKPFYKHDNNTWILPLSLSFKTELLSMPDYEIYLYWKGVLNESIESWIFKIEKIDIGGSLALFEASLLSDFELPPDFFIFEYYYVIILSVMIVIYAVTLVLNSKGLNFEYKENNPYQKGNKK